VADFRLIARPTPPAQTQTADVTIHTRDLRKFPDLIKVSGCRCTVVTASLDDQRPSLSRNPHGHSLYHPMTVRDSLVVVARYKKNRPTSKENETKETFQRWPKILRNRLHLTPNHVASHVLKGQFTLHYLSFTTEPSVTGPQMDR
jgi:hypothetical protein